MLKNIDINRGNDQNKFHALVASHMIVLNSHIYVSLPLPPPRPSLHSEIHENGLEKSNLRIYV